MSDSEQTTCPDCGTRYPANDFGGLCPGCLLLGIDDGEDDTSSAIADLAGTRIDGYVLVEKLGEGGMGSVWKARQEEPIEREVALKLIKPGMDSRSVLARFEAERQVLADLDHPGIAKIFDAGTTENGRPYYVMELVDGLPITGYCERWQLLTRERLALLVNVCEAIGYAHGRGVLHRDLKPTNILVADHAEGRLKVIDFGIAKSEALRSLDPTLLTRVGQLVGTPSYMSPEQAEGDADIDGRADVYSLGAVLYELLCDVPPFEEERLREIGLLEVARVIREEDPPRPSTRSADAPSGDLDWIALKALAKKPAERYQQPADLADDLERYLRGETVVAKAPTFGKRIAKWLRRHKAAAVAVAAAIPIALLVFALTRPEGEHVDPHAAGMVTSTADSGAGSLRELIDNAAPRSTIEFAPALSGRTIVLDGQPIAIEKKLTLDASALENGITIDAGGKSRVFTITGEETLAKLIGLTITGGDAADGDGGAIHVAAFLEIERCHLRNNQAQNGGALFTKYKDTLVNIRKSLFTDNVAEANGGAIRGKVTVVHSTFANNEAHRGGAVHGEAKLRGCTLADNACVAREGADSKASGGAAMFEDPGSLTIIHCTITGNRAEAVGGVHCADPQSHLYLKNSILSGNLSTSGADSSDLVVKWFENKGGNLTGGGSDPILAPLGDHGGPVPTRPPLPGSPVIDAAKDLEDDEMTTRGAGTHGARGVVRAIDGDGDGIGKRDIGAVEFDPARDRK